MLGDQAVWPCIYLVKILSFNIYRLPLRNWILCARYKMNKTWSLPSRSPQLSGESRHLLHQADRLEVSGHVSVAALYTVTKLNRL